MNVRTRLVAEFVGSMILTATVVGSGIMAAQLADGNDAVALLANTGATILVLAVLIAALAPISGAHFNPAVTLVMTMLRRLSAREGFGYALAQIAGCCAGAALAHAMFDLPLIQVSTHIRTGPPQWLSEVVAATGLVLVILSATRSNDVPWMVASWIGAAYWFTASTSFANPAISIARSLSDTFAGIRPVDVLPFVGCQLLGACIGLALARVLFPARFAPITSATPAN